MIGALNLRHLGAVDFIYLISALHKGHFFFVWFVLFKDVKLGFFYLFIVSPDRAEKCVMASSGFQADVKALQKVLSARHLVSRKLKTTT